MSGLEKIIAEIAGEAEAEARELLAEAQRQADAATQEVREQSAAQLAKLAAERDASVEDIRRAGESARALQRRQRILATKQELLDETLRAAQALLLKLPEPEYFALLLKMVAANAEEGSGEILLNQWDRARVPQSFVDGLASVLPAGKTLSVSAQTRPIDGGFILKYGDIELNCSFAAIFDARREEFADAVQGILFAS